MGYCLVFEFSPAPTQKELSEFYFSQPDEQRCPTYVDDKDFVVVINGSWELSGHAIRPYGEALIKYFQGRGFQVSTDWEIT